jgi:hypothetical protein
MFTHTLQLEERLVLLSLAILLVHVDGNVDSTESTRLRALRREMALPSDTELPEDPVGMLPQPFSSMESRVRVLLELLLIAAADDYFDPRERDFIGNVAEQVSIPSERLEAMIGWTREHAQLMKAAEQFWT